MKYFYMGSCWKKYELDQLSIRVLKDYNPDVMFYAGDFPYTEEDLTRWGYTTVDVSASLANNTDVDAYRDHHSQIRAMPYSKQVIANCKQFWYMWDDHETPQDDGANDLTYYQDYADKNGGLTWSGAATAQNQADAWAAARTASEENMTTNPANTDAGIDADALYFSYVMGSVTYVVLDCMSYRSPRTATDNSSKVMMGATQEAWAIDKINNATTPFVAICTKPIYQTGGNQDTYHFYQTERDRFYGSLTKTGIIALSGDQHVPCYAESTLGGTTIANIIGCPTSQTINAPTGAIGSQVLWRWGGLSSVTANETRAAILIEDPENNEWVKVRILSPIKGVDHWHGYLVSGSNEIVYSV